MKYNLKRITDKGTVLEGPDKWQGLFVLLLLVYLFYDIRIYAGVEN